MKDALETVKKNLTLDPTNWKAMRHLGHQMLDDMMDHLEHIAKAPAWRPIPKEVKTFLEQEIPQESQEPEKIYKDFIKYILPYNTGNIHPRFFAWVQGTGTPMGMLSEMLAATMNANVAIGEHAAMYVDQQILSWCKQMMHYPDTASGILLSGASVANTIALTVARDYQLQLPIHKEGLQNISRKMVLYCSTETHNCVEKSVAVLGLGTEALRKIPTKEGYTINTIALEQAIEQDIAAGYAPFCVVGNIGTVNTGAIDPIDELVEICKKYNLWLHIDGAFGALIKLLPEYEQQLQSLKKADSIAFDLHKWMYMPYEIACVLIKNAHAHRSSFAADASYLSTHERGLAAGPDPYSNYGIELSRGFKSLKVWMSIKEHGIKKYADLIRQNIAQAFYLGELVKGEKNLQLLTPVTLNIVCYRYIKNDISADQLNLLNKEILMQLQEQGIATPSSTILHGEYAIRVCFVNHRTCKGDIELLVKETIRIGNTL